MALIHCPECNAEVSAQAPACPQCGHPISRHRPSSSTGRKAAIAVAATLGVIVVGLLLRYGTVSPCGMLEKEVSARVMQKVLEDKPENEFEAAGVGIGMALIGPLIRGAVSSMSPMQCARAMVDVHLRGEESLTDRFREHFNVPAEETSDSGTADDTPRSSDTESAVTPELDARATDVPEKPKWESQIETSPIDDSLNVYLTIKADEPITGQYGRDARPVLLARCKENRTDVYVALGFRPDTDYGSGGSRTTRLTLRYGSEPATEAQYSLSTSGDAVFLGDAIPILKRMLKHDKLLLRVAPSGDSPQIATFDLSGLSGVIEPLRSACGW